MWDPLHEVVASLCRPFALQELSMRNLSIKDLSPLSACCGLTELEISDTRVADLGPLEALKETLSILIAEECPIKDLRPLSHLSRLRSLDLSGVKVRGEAWKRTLQGL